MESTEALSVSVTLFLVTKFPRVGLTKSRLVQSGLSEHLALKFSQFSILDLVDSFGSRDFEKMLLKKLQNSECSKPCMLKLHRVVLTSAGENTEDFQNWLKQSSENGASWRILNMETKTGDSANTAKLGFALGKAFSMRQYTGDHAVAFIGMDTPHISTEHVATSLARAASWAMCSDINRLPLRSNASIFPAEDGGYVLLALPCNVESPESVFDDVEWSTSRTFATQTEAIRKAGMNLIMGQETYCDVDDLKSFESLKQRYLDKRDDGSRLSRYFRELDRV